MNIFELKNSKLGMTLVEMVISLAILSVLMTSTMGMIVSSNNLFISTSKASIDKQVGNGIYEMMRDVLKYTTHLEISDQVNSGMNQNFSIDNLEYEGDKTLESGWLYYKPKDGDRELLYNSSFYGSGEQKRTIQYSVTKYVGDDGRSDGKHVNLTVKVIREGKVVYTRSSIVRCVNLALVTGGSGNSVKQSSTAPEFNQVLSFTVNEQLISGGSSAWNIEYKINEYLARYNTILKNYYSAIYTPITNLNDYYGLHSKEVTNKYYTETYVDQCVEAVFGDTTLAGGYDATCIDSDGNLPTAKGAEPEVDGNDYTTQNNLRAYYQKQIYDLLKFSPSTITENDDPYYKIIASKEELYLGFMLTYYNKNNDKTITQNEYPTFDDPQTFFANTTLYKYATGDASAAPNDSMVILGYFRDTNNGTFYVNNKDYYATKTERKLTVSETGFADHIDGYDLYGDTSPFAYVSKEHSTHYRYKHVVGVTRTSDVDTTKPYIVNKTFFTITNNGRSSEYTGETKNVGTYYTAGDHDEKLDELINEGWLNDVKNTYRTGTLHKYYYPTEETKVTKTATCRNYTLYSVPSPSTGNAITLNIKENQVDTKWSYSTDKLDILTYDDTKMVASHTYKAIKRENKWYSPISKKEYVSTIDASYTTTKSIYSDHKSQEGVEPTKSTKEWSNGTFNNDGWNSWSAVATTLTSATSLNAKNIASYATCVYGKTINDGDEYTGYSTESSITNDSEKYTKAGSKYDPTTCSVIVITATQDIQAGWYYYLEGTSGGTQAYHFFYLDSCTIADSDKGQTYQDKDGKTQTYVVNADDIAVSSGKQIFLFSSGWKLQHYCYQQTQFKLANNIEDLLAADDDHTVKFNTFDIKEHQYNDWVLYSVDWNSWFSKENTGLINGVISTIERFFTGDTSISEITPANASDSLGCTGQFEVNKIDSDSRSYNLAWMVYASDLGTWYYLPQSSNIASTYLSKKGWYSNKDGPTLLNVEGWANSTAINDDIINRKLSKNGLFGINNVAGVDTSLTTDVNWTSLPSTNDKVTGS